MNEETTNCLYLYLSWDVRKGQASSLYNTGMLQVYRAAQQ